MRVLGPSIALQVLHACEQNDLNQVLVHIGVGSTHSSNANTPRSNELVMQGENASSPSVAAFHKRKTVSQTDANGDTALHWGVRHGNTALVSLLLEQDICSPKQANKAGRTALHEATLLLDDSVSGTLCQLLIMWGADVRAVDGHGKTPLELAVTSQARKVIQEQSAKLDKAKSVFDALAEQVESDTKKKQNVFSAHWSVWRRALTHRHAANASSPNYRTFSNDSLSLSNTNQYSTLSKTPQKWNSSQLRAKGRSNTSLDKISKSSVNSKQEMNNSREKVHSSTDRLEFPMKNRSGSEPYLNAPPEDVVAAVVHRELKPRIHLTVEDLSQDLNQDSTQATHDPNNIQIIQGSPLNDSMSDSTRSQSFHTKLSDLKDLEKEKSLRNAASLVQGNGNERQEKKPLQIVTVPPPILPETILLERKASIQQTSSKSNSRRASVVQLPPFPNGIQFEQVSVQNVDSLSMSRSDIQSVNTTPGNSPTRRAVRPDSSHAYDTPSNMSQTSLNQAVQGLMLHGTSQDPVSMSHQTSGSQIATARTSKESVVIDMTGIDTALTMRSNTRHLSTDQITRHSVNSARYVSTRHRLAMSASNTAILATVGETPEKQANQLKVQAQQLETDIARLQKWREKLSLLYSQDVPKWFDAARQGQLEGIISFVEKTKNWQKHQLLESPTHANEQRWVTDPVNAQNEKGWTALILACQAGHFNVVDYLLETKRCQLDLTNQNQETCFYRTAAAGHVPILARLFAQMEKSLLEKCNNEQRCALHAAALNGRAAACQWLLEHFPEQRNARDKNQKTPLALAAYEGHSDIVQILLGVGADHSAKDRFGWTPLHMAAYNGHLETVVRLMDAGADAHSQALNGKTPAILARDRGHTALANALDDP